MTDIEWTDVTWNPVTGCRKVSAGCAHCYAATWAARQMGQWKGRAFEDVRVHPDRLDAPLHWRKPRRVFVNSMSDLFHDDVSDEFIARVFQVMTGEGSTLPMEHTFQILTKRPERMRRFLREVLPTFAGNDDAELDAVGLWGRDIGTSPRVWLGVSAEDQERADERIPLLLATPAAVRFVSYEPALGPVEFNDYLTAQDEAGDSPAMLQRGLHWIIVGGESGPGARPFDVAWARSTVEQCRAAGVACFVKQLGARPRMAMLDTLTGVTFHDDGRWTESSRFPPLKDRKGGDPTEWPEDLRVRQWPDQR